MSRDNRFAFMSMGRPFVSTMATPDAMDKDARLQLIYLYQLAGSNLPLANGTLHAAFSVAPPRMTFSAAPPKMIFTVEG